MGLVAFATYPETVAPLTLSHSVLVEMLEQEQARPPEEGQTNIGDAIAEALDGHRTDSSEAAIRLARTFATPEDGLGASRSAANLRGAGLDADIAYCARVSVLDVVGRFSRMVGNAAEVVAS